MVELIKSYCPTSSLTPVLNPPPPQNKNDPHTKNEQNNDTRFHIFTVALLVVYTPFVCLLLSLSTSFPSLLSNDNSVLCYRSKM